jgi:hypothetical protein
MNFLRELVQKRIQKKKIHQVIINQKMKKILQEEVHIKILFHFFHL